MNREEEKGRIMSKNPDTYLLYEYMEKVPFTVRMKVCLDSKIDKELLTKGSAGGNQPFPVFQCESRAG